ncbi:MAG: GDP-mannose 4,6-dehydratase, partial [Alphaproteobacteria bacterium]
MTSILVTGGAGYIGSHTTTSLLNSGHDVTILDNLSNCDATVIDRIERISATRPELIVGDVRDDDLLNQIFQ